MLRVEPTSSTAAEARNKGISIVEDFGEQLAKKLLKERGSVDLMAANNVLAHVPNINDFVKGLIYCYQKMELLLLIPTFLKVIY